MDLPLFNWARNRRTPSWRDVASVAMGGLNMTAGILTDTGNSMKDILGSISNEFGLFGANALTLGKIVLGVAARFKSAIMLFVDLGEGALGDLMSGGRLVASNTARGFGQVFQGDIGRIFTTDTIQNTYVRMAAGAANSADARTAQQTFDKNTQRNLEFSMR